MAQAFRLELKQSQQLVMTPQLQQAIRLLQMSNLELHGFVEQELERNPLLRLDSEAVTHGAAEGAQGEVIGGRDIAEMPLDSRITDGGDRELVTDTLDTGHDNLYDRDGTDRDRPVAIGGPGAGSRLGDGIPSRGSEPAGYDWNELPDEAPGLRAHLLGQLGLMRAEPAVAALAVMLVDELDPDGYLRGGLQRPAARLGASAAEAEAALAMLQACEPTGVGARDLAECLALQLAERDRLDPAMRLLLDHIGLLAQGERRRLTEICGVDGEDLSEMLTEIRALDPRPGTRFAIEPAEILVPDLFLRRGRAGGWELELNPDTLPKVLVDNHYAAELSRRGREARSFVSDCRASGNWLIRSLDQRARTLLKVTAEIVRFQDSFFERGVAGLKPLTLAMVAEATELHESTVSRVTTNKHLATERGVLELKFFFTNAVGGAEGTSAESVRQRIRSMVATEDAGGVLSDDAIVERLQSDGVEIARRTVAKYRKQLGIPASSERRRARALKLES